MTSTSALLTSIAVTDVTKSAVTHTVAFQKQLDLYVAAAGFHPARVLPCVIDVGTNNEALRKDRTYLGLDQPRLEGDEYLRYVYTLLTLINGSAYTPITLIIEVFIPL
jgi:Malic enzyme, N-terminal domain